MLGLFCKSSSQTACISARRLGLRATAVRNGGQRRRVPAAPADRLRGRADRLAAEQNLAAVRVVAQRAVDIGEVDREPGKADGDGDADVAAGDGHERA